MNDLKMATIYPAQIGYMTSPRDGFGETVPSNPGIDAGERGRCRVWGVGRVKGELRH